MDYDVTATVDLGNVGLITMAHVPSLKEWDRQRMSERGVAFDKALQLTNILRDLPRDLRLGRCYLPQPDLAGIGMSAEQLLDPSNSAAARPVLVAWIQVAMEYYDSAEQYLLAIPRNCPRLRLAVLWPILIGLATMAKLANNRRWLDPAFPSKVSRWWVYRTLALSWPSVYSNRVLQVWISRLRSWEIQTWRLVSGGETATQPGQGQTKTP